MNPYAQLPTLNYTVEIAEHTCCQCVRDVKAFCSETVGSEMLLMLGFLVLFNYVSLFFWKKLSEKQITFGKFGVRASIIVPAINFLLCGILLVYAWNAF